MRKNPGVAAVLSFFFSGLGQIYNGQIGKGLLFISAQTVSLFLMFILIGFITSPIIWIWGMVDAYRTAERINHERDPEEEDSEAEIVPVSHLSGKKCRHCHKNLVYPMEIKHDYCNRCIGIAGASAKDDFIEGLTLREEKETLVLDDDLGEAIDRAGKELQLDLGDEKPMFLDEEEPPEAGKVRRGTETRQPRSLQKPDWVTKEENAPEEKKKTVWKKPESPKRSAPKPASRRFANREEYERWREEQMRVAQAKHEGQA
jgi:TM2 domain-containing membrane protein YozV